MAQYASILFSMILVNNFVLVKFLGICPFLGVSNSLIPLWAWVPRSRWSWCSPLP